MDNLDPIDIEFLINTEQVKQDSKKVKDDLRGIGETGSKSAEDYERHIVELTKRLNELGVAQNKNQQTAKRTQSTYNGLGNSINQISRELPAFTYSAQTGFLALSNNIPILADEIARLGAKNKELVASGEKSVPVWKQVAKGLFSWNTALSLGVTILTIYGPQIVKFIGSLFNVRKEIDANKKSVEALNKAYEGTEYSKAIAKVLELKSTLKLATQGIGDSDKALKEYNETLGKVVGNANDVNEAEKLLEEKAPAYIQSMLYRAAAMSAVSDAAKALAENQKAQYEAEQDIINKQSTLSGRSARNTGTQSGPGYVNVNFVTDQLAAELKSAKKELEDLKKEAGNIESESSKIIENFQKRAAKIAEAAGLNFAGTDGHTKNLIDNYQKLMDKLADIDAEYARKKLNNDEEELQALRDKFDKIRKEIQEYNKDPKNKLKIGLAGLNRTFEDAQEDLKYKQGTAKLKTELEEQKKLFVEFEEYQKTFGEKAAKEKYSAQLGEFDTYLDLLNDKIANNKSTYDAIATGNATGGQEERAKLLDTELEKENAAQEKQYQKLLAGLQDYEKKRILLIDNFNKVRLQLLADGHNQEAEEFNRQFKEKLDELDISNAKGTEEYKALVEGVEELSIKAAKTVVASAKKMVSALVDAGKLSKDAAKEINKEISKVDSDVQRKQDLKVQDYLFAFSNIGAELERSTDKMAQNIGQMVTGITNAIGTLSDSNASGLSKASGLVGLIIQLGNFIQDIGEQDYNKAVTSQKNLNKQLADRISMEKQINDIKRERAEIERNSSAFLDSYYKEDFTAAIQKQIDSEKTLKKSMEALAENGIFTAEGTGKRLLFGSKTESRDFTLEQVLGGKFIPDYFRTDPARDGDTARSRFFDPLSVFGGYSDLNVEKDALKNLQSTFDDTLRAMGKTSADVANFTTQEWLDFYTLLEESGKIQDEGTKKLLANAKEATAEYQKALEEMRDIISSFAGSLGNELGNSLVTAFQQGTDAADEFKKSLNNILTNLFVQDLINTQFRTYFDKLQEEMEKSLGSGGDQSWLDDIERFASNIEPALGQASAAVEAFDKVLKNKGYDGFGTPAKDNEKGLQGAIRRELTEETASELTGLFRGQYDITKQHYQLSQKAFDISQRHYDASVGILQNTVLIEKNTANTVLQLQFAVVELKNITKNTKPSQTSRDLGLG